MTKPNLTAAANSKLNTKPKSATPRGRGYRIVGVCILLGLICIGLAGGYIWRQEIYNARDEHRGRIARLETQTQAVLTAQHTMRERQTATDNAIANLRDKIQTATGHIGRLQTEINRGDEARAIRDAEQLLILAHRRLTLDADAVLAGKALRLAAKQLRQLAHPEFARARELLAAEIAAVDAIAAVDVAAVAIAFGKLRDKLDALPLAGDRLINPSVNTAYESNTATDLTLADATKLPNADKTDNIIWSMLSKLFTALGGIVQVETGDTARAPILSVELRRVMIEQPRLILESAQLAFQRGQGGLYAARMRDAKNWIDANFDTESAAVADWRRQLDALAATHPLADLPDISNSLTALRAANRALAR